MLWEPQEKVLERGERIEILVDKTDNLNQASVAFKRRSVALRRQMWWKNTRSGSPARTVDGRQTLTSSSVDLQ